MSRRIAVLGGGHGARTIAADMTLAGHTVTLFEFEKFHDNTSAIFQTGQIEILGEARNGLATLHQTTHGLGEAVRDTELILIVVPAPVHRVYAHALVRHLKDDANIVLIPGTLGSLEFLHILKTQGCKAKNITVSEWDTLPYATRIQSPNSVKVFHNLSEFGMGVYPASQTERIGLLVKELYPGVTMYQNVLEAGLSNCNPVIHPLGVLMNAGRIEYSRGEFYYYEEGITASTAKAMEALDDERIAIGPTVLSNRYVTEDVPIGLVCWSQLGDMLGVPTPLMKATIAIGNALADEDYWATGRTLEKCGITNMTAQQLNDYVS